MTNEATNKAAPAEDSVGAAARSEKNGKPKHYTWRGIKLELQPDPPGSLLWDFREFERQQETGNDRVSPILDLLESLIGREQERKVRNKIAADRISLADTTAELSKLLEGILKKYGMGVGESRASRSS